jgi:LDH2 family malate/lactate/ureidoglycolate dehydrogenase
MVTTSATKSVSFERLSGAVCDILTAVKVPDGEARLVAAALATAEARGMASHGVIRLPVYADRIRRGGIKPGHSGIVLKETASTLLLDGEDGLGAVLAARGMTEAVARAQSTGVGMVGIRRSNHFGEAGYFVRSAVEAGMIGLLTTNGSPNMPPWGGTDKLFGTLPLAVGIPAGRHPAVVLDIALGVVSKGKILVAARGGAKIPLGWGVDSTGAVTDDPNKVLDGGWTQPIGGHKGSGMIMVLEVLTGILTGSGIVDAIGDLYEDPERPQNLGHFAAAIDIGSFIPLESFKQGVDHLIDLVKASPLAPGHDEILVPGEREHRLELKAKETGIHLDQETRRQLRDLAAAVDAPQALAILDGDDA